MVGTAREVRAFAHPTGFTRAIVEEQWLVQFYCMRVKTIQYKPPDAAIDTTAAVAVAAGGNLCQRRTSCISTNGTNGSSRNIRTSGIAQPEENSSTPQIKTCGRPNSRASHTR